VAAETQRRNLVEIASCRWYSGLKTDRYGRTGEWLAPSSTVIKPHGFSRLFKLRRHRPVVYLLSLQCYIER